ncbi:MAG: hypothetical protein Q9194_003993 [Teloschistes cf. exilis]
MNPDPPSPVGGRIIAESLNKHPVLTTPLQEIEDVENERSMMTPIEVAERYNRLTVGAEPWLELALDDLPQLESIKGEQKQTDMQHDRLTVGTIHRSVASPLMQNPALSSYKF